MMRWLASAAVLCAGLLSGGSLLDAPPPAKADDPVDIARSEPARGGRTLDPSDPAVFPDEPIDLVPEMVPLRQGDSAEWAEFLPLDPDSLLTVEFVADPHEGASTLEITQYDVRQEWRILLNGVDVGMLERDEQLMTVYRDVDDEALEDGVNVLQIVPAGGDADDIRVGRIVLHPRPEADVLSEVRVRIRIVDEESSRALPARVTVVDEHGARQSLYTDSAADPLDHQTARPGTIYSGDGEAAFGLPAGRFTIYASRGFEYSADSLRVDVEAGDRIDHELRIRRSVPTQGWIAMDTHIHTLEYSGHGDASADERILTLAGEGIELPVLTEHNISVDLAPLADSMGYGAYMRPIIGMEYTTPVGHFNVFPMDEDWLVPDPGVTDWSALQQELESIGPPDAVILNHARDMHAGFRPFGPSRFLAVVGQMREGEPVPANAMEIVNSSAQQGDVMRLVRDWFGMLNAGHFLTPVGSSDSHDVARYIVGQGRTYVKVEDDSPAGVDLERALESFEEGQVVATFGLLPIIEVGSGYGPGTLAPAADSVRIQARVLAPAWLEADRVALFRNGVKIREERIEASGASGEKWSGSWTVPVGGHDAYFSVVALGPGETPPFWPIARPYQHDSISWNPAVMGVTGAVWIDADGDGERTPARVYARRIVEESGGELGAVIDRLSAYDEAVASQAAAVLYLEGMIGPAFDVEAELSGAPGHVQRGIRAFMEALRG